MAYIPSGILTHSKKVCRFYKRAVRHLESCIVDLKESRYQIVLLRAEFDKNKDMKDLRLAKEILINAEKELDDQRHYSYKKFAESPGGTAYAREHVPPDWILDYWDPMEKAMYPKYFETREKRKKEYEEFYRKQYGEPSSSGHH